MTVMNQNVSDAYAWEFRNYFIYLFIADLILEWQTYMCCLTFDC